MDEHWTARDIAKQYGWASPEVARKAIQRWTRAGLLAPVTDEHGHVLRDPGTDAKLYRPADVEAAKAYGLGKGRRRTVTPTTERRTQ